MRQFAFWAMAALGSTALAACTPEGLGPSSTPSFSSTSSHGPSLSTSAPTMAPQVAQQFFPPRSGVAVAHLGSKLITVEGITLYNRAGDPRGASTCDVGCLGAFQPYLVAPGGRVGGGATIIQRRDGRAQWAASNRALYTFSGDQQLHDTFGEGQQGFAVAPYPPR